MELRAPEVAAADHGRHLRAIVRGRERDVGYGRGIAVHEVHVLVLDDIREQRIGAQRRELVPTHMRYRSAGLGFEATYAIGNDAETLRRTFFGAREQQLHAEAD